MHLRSLKIFCDIVARRSFSRAADENGVSQSAASQVVHQLEEQLDVRLIDRSKRPFVLTPEGEVYHHGCRKIVERYAALEDRVRTLHDEVAGRVSIASIYSAGLHHMNCIVQEFLRQNPKANVRLEYQHPDRVRSLVEEDQVDLGLISYPKSTRQVEALAWREEPMVLVCPPAHPLASRSSILLEDLAGARLVGFDTDLEIRRQIDRALAEREVDVQVTMEFDNIETIKRAVEINAGAALLPRPTVAQEVAAGTLVAVDLADRSLVRPLGIIRRRGRELNGTTLRFIELLKTKADAKKAPEPPGPAAHRTPSGDAAHTAVTAT